LPNRCPEKLERFLKSMKSRRVLKSLIESPAYRAAFLENARIKLGIEIRH